MQYLEAWEQAQYQHIIQHVPGIDAMDLINDQGYQYQVACINRRGKHISPVLHSEKGFRACIHNLAASIDYRLLDCFVSQLISNKHTSKTSLAVASDLVLHERN